MPPTKKLQTSARAEFIQPVPPPPQLQKVVLEMRPEVAQTLRILCGFISGSPDGRRGHMDEISRALGAAGVRNVGRDSNDVDYSDSAWPHFHFTSKVSE